MEVQGVNYRIKVCSELMGFQLHKVLTDNADKINDFICSLSPDIKGVTLERISLQR